MKANKFLKIKRTPDVEEKRGVLKSFQELDTEYGTSQVAAYQSAVSAISALEAQSLCASLPFDPLAIFCTRTGQQIGTRTWEQVYSLIALKGPEAKRNLELLQENAIAAHWLQTDADMLEKLRVVDPVGYFVYAASYVVKHQYRSPKVLKENETEAAHRLFREKIAAYTSLRSRADNENLHIANGHLQNLLAYRSEAIGLPFRSLEELVRAYANGTLYSVITQAFRTWINKEVQFNLSAERLANLFNENMGPSQFRKKRDTKKAKAKAEADDFFASLLAMGISSLSTSAKDLKPGQPRTSPPKVKINPFKRLAEKPASADVLDLSDLELGASAETPAETSTNKWAEIGRNRTERQMLGETGETDAEIDVDAEIQVSLEDLEILGDLGFMALEPETTEPVEEPASEPQAKPTFAKFFARKKDV